MGFYPPLDYETISNIKYNHGFSTPDKKHHFYDNTKT